MRGRGTLIRVRSRNRAAGTAESGEQTSELLDALRRAGVSDVDASPLSRALYSTDASLYRVPPAAVLRPRHVDEVRAALEICRRLGMSFTSRGAGTSIAGNAIGPGLVVDFSRHLDAVVSVDADRRQAVVEPGVVQSTLQKHALAQGLRFGPDPSTHNRCTIGGMIGNNACGSRALAYGRTSDNVLGLEVLAGTGQVLRLDISGSTHAPLLARLRSLVDADLATIRTQFGRFSRQGSGYPLEYLLPERNFAVAPALVGSEGTLGVVLQATVRLVEDPPYRGLLVLGYRSMPEAADAVPAVLPFGPTACEGLDSRIVDAVRSRPGAAVPDLPAGAGWLFVEIAGSSPTEVQATAHAVVRDAAALDSLLVTDPLAAAALWRIREDGAGLAARTPDGEPAHAGWEDAAVPPEHLGAYLRRFDALLNEYRLTGLPYGHFGDGCVHVRIDFPLAWGEDTGRYRAFVLDAAALVAEYGGSLSGEHGDGRARSELLPFMYSSEAIALMGRVKSLFDPDDVLNPGVLVRPRPLDADLRNPGAPPLTRRLALSYRHDHGDFATAVHRCTGVGKCRADTTAVGGVMCPSYQATRNEKDTTRGRARVLQEMVNDGGVTSGWRSPEVHEALDLCLSCKGCSRDCPTGVDMASYKAEVLYQTYRHRPRPRSHYTLGWLPRWARLVSRFPGPVNGLLGLPLGSRAAAFGAGIDPRRGIPRFAPQTFDSWWARRTPVSAGGRPVLLWVDTFSNYFSPEIPIAAVRVLEAAGYRVEVPAERLCCGLTWISTGQLDAAKRIIAKTVNALRPATAAGTPIVGLEPSCTAALRSDSVDLLGVEMAADVAGNVHTLAEQLRATVGWRPPRLEGTHVVAQPHCHHHAVMGWNDDAALLRDAGASVTRLGGCCGLAGNWGVERGHHDVSVAIAEHQLLPATRTYPDDPVLADGFSCRTQLDDLAGRRGIHLAQLLGDRLPS